MNPQSSLEHDLRAALQSAPPPLDLLPGIERRLAHGPSPAPRLRPWWTLAAVAALVVLALGVGLVWQQRQHRLEQQQARVAALQLTHALHLAATDLQRVQARVLAAND